MHICQDLTFHKHTGNSYFNNLVFEIIGGLTGFVDIGDINNHLSQYESQVCNDDITDSLATSMLVLRISGLFMAIDFHMLHFPALSYQVWLHEIIAFYID